jgi:O-antigen ligase
MFAIMTVALKKSSKIYVLASMAFGAIALMTTQSRGAWLGALFVVFVYLCFERRRWLIGFLPLAVASTLAIGHLSPRMGQSIGTDIDRSSSERLHVWEGYWEIFKEHPWFGIGLSQGDKYLPEYYERLGIVEPFVSHAHNVPLQWAAGAGVFSLMLYVWISLWFLLAAWRLRTRSPWGWGLFLAQIFWQFGGLTQANFFDAEVNHIIVFTWALILLFTFNGACRSQDGELATDLQSL